jgi:DNA-binding transcriptional MerR regulator
MSQTKDQKYSIGDVSGLIDVPCYTLRYWGKEFGEFLHPQRGKGGQRVYGEYEIELLKRIKSLLWEEKYSIAGAKLKLQNSLLNDGKIENEELLQKILALVNADNLTPQKI